MRIRFDSERARDYLLSHGYVYTLRTWYNPRQVTATAISGGKPIGLVSIYLIGAVPLDSEVLAKYVGGSGFSNADEWVEEFMRLNKGRKIKNAYLYRVELIKKR